ncbi:MAG TPA: type II toxin-antitoxin system HicA family toxin [Saprospiraceae bacterium]|nr:type II toxin-antitoxin system HicA family toxin [Saprospiraceae bacterium]
MKLPRNESGESLTIKLTKVGYFKTRQKGSHIRLTNVDLEGKHHITIPNHNPIKIGTLSRILLEVASRLEISKDELLKRIES